MSTDDTWIEFYSTRHDELRSKAEPLFERPAGVLDAVKTVESAKTLLDEYGKDDWSPTKVVVGRLGCRRAWLLSQINEDEQALSELNEIATELFPAADPDVAEVGADARLDRSRLLWALDRRAEAFASARELITDISGSEHPGTRHTLANTYMSLIRWTSDSVSEEDGIAGQQRIVSACEELIDAHGDSENGPEAFYVVVALDIEIDALREHARLLRESGMELEAAALEMRVHTLADDAWQRYNDYDDSQVQARLAQFVLDSRENSSEADQMAIADRVLARFGSSDDEDMIPEITWAMQYRARGLRVAGNIEQALRTLDELASRFNGSDQERVKISLLWGLAEKAQILKDQGEGETMVPHLQAATSLLGEDASPGLRRRVAVALDLVCDIRSEALPPPPVDDQIAIDGVDKYNEQQVQFPKTAEMADYAAAVDSLVQQFADDKHPQIREIAADALNSLGFAQRRHLNLDDAVATYQRIIGLFNDDTYTGIEITVASVHLNLGFILSTMLNRHQEALTVYDAALERYHGTTNSNIRDTLAKVASSRLFCLNNMNSLGMQISYGDQYEDLSLEYRKKLSATLDEGVELYDEGKYREAIAKFDEILTNNIDSMHPELRRRCLDAMVRKGYCLYELGQYDSALKVNREAVARFGSELAMDLQKDIAYALLNASKSLDRLGRHEEEISVYNEIIHRWSESSVPYMAIRVAHAWFAKGATLEELGHSGEAQRAYSSGFNVAMRSDQPDVRIQGANSAVNLGLLLRKLGQQSQAIDIYEQVISQLGNDTDKRIRKQVALAHLGLAKANTNLGDVETAIAEYRLLLDQDPELLTQKQWDVVKRELADLQKPATDKNADKPTPKNESIWDGIKRWFRS